MYVHQLYIDEFDTIRWIAHLMSAGRVSARRTEAGKYMAGDWLKAQAC